MHQRMGSNLPSSKPSGKSCPGLGVAERVLVHLLTALLVNGFSFDHSVIYSAHKQAHNQNTENKDLSSSSKREHMKYRAWIVIFEWFLNGMAKTELGEAG